MEGIENMAPLPAPEQSREEEISSAIDAKRVMDAPSIGSEAVRRLSLARTETANGITRLRLVREIMFS